MDPEEDGDADHELQQLTSSETGLLTDALAVLRFSVFTNAASDVSLYVISDKGEVQNMGVADIGERGIHCSFDDWEDFPKETVQGSYRCNLVPGLREIPY